MTEFSEEQHEFTPPRREHWQFHGKVTADQINFLFEHMIPRVKDLDYFFLSVDLNNFNGATPEARRLSADLLKPLPPRAVAIVGGGFAERMIAKLVTRAQEMLSGERRQFTGFFKEIGAADEWFETMHETLLEAASKEGSKSSKG